MRSATFGPSFVSHLARGCLTFLPLHCPRLLCGGGCGAARSPLRSPLPCASSSPPPLLPCSPSLPLYSPCPLSPPPRRRGPFPRSAARGLHLSPSITRAISGSRLAGRTRHARDTATAAAMEMARRVQDCGGDGLARARRRRRPRENEVKSSSPLFLLRCAPRHPRLFGILAAGRWMRWRGRPWRSPSLSRPLQ